MATFIWHALQPQKCSFPQVTGELMCVTDTGSLFPPSESWLMYLFAFIGCRVSTLHVCRVGYPFPLLTWEDGSLRCAITRGGLGEGGVVLLFRGENDELVQEAKQNSIRCQFYQSCFPQSRVSLTVFVAEVDDSLSRRSAFFSFFFPVWKAGQVNVCVSVPCLLSLWNSAEALSPESNPTPRLKISQH